MSQNPSSPGAPLGVDVSKYQGSVNWSAVAASGVSFAFARVADGATNPDPHFAQNWSGMKEAGLLRGAYQFFRPTEDPLVQADLFITQVVQLAPGDLPPVLDVETADGASASQIVEAIARWQQTVEGALGRQMMVYTAHAFWQSAVGNSAQFADRPLWVAEYTTAPAPVIPSAWPVWTFWQYSESGHVNGIAGAVDLDKFNGTPARLRALAGYTDAPQT